MSQGIIRTCPSCGARNRVQSSRLAAQARCGKCGTALPAIAEPVEVDESGELAGLLRESALPVLIDFWAPWCGPCKAVAPEIAKVAERNAGRLLVVKVNTDVDPAVGQAYRIQGIPTMALYAGGREVERTSGARPAAAIQAFADQALARAGATVPG